METKKIISGNFEVTVNIKIKNTDNTYLLRIKNAFIPQNFIPGQFVMIKPNFCCSDPLLARPFSVFRKFNENEFEILYRVCGKGTELLSNVKKGDYVSVTGPSGNGFDTSSDFQILQNKGSAKIIKNIHVLIAGGIGIAPLFSLPYFIKNNIITKNNIEENEENENYNLEENNKIILYYGSKTENELYFRHSIHSSYDEVYFATDDGSFGYKGNIVDLLFYNMEDYYLKNFRLKNEDKNNKENKKIVFVNQEIIKSEENANIKEQLNIQFYSCGPKSMLSNLINKFSDYSSNIFEKHSLQVSLEEHFACGIGVCLGCVIKINSNNNNSDNFIFKRVCKEGPVFEASELYNY
ncbi:MAG: dihydroorotate dehydrogenase electron transfer subunit [bacterium]